MTRVVCGVLFRSKSDRRVLVGMRAGVDFNGCWEFPGGKLEAGESRTSALVREWLEELGAHAIVGEQVYAGEHGAADGSKFEMVAYAVDSRTEPRRNPSVHTRHWWASLSELVMLPDTKATPTLKPIVRALQRDGYGGHGHGRVCITCNGSGVVNVRVKHGPSPANDDEAICYAPDHFEPAYAQQRCPDCAK